MDENMHEIMEFQITVISMELLCMSAPTNEIATELILLEASYGPPRNSMTE